MSPQLPAKKLGRAELQRRHERRQDRRLSAETMDTARAKALGAYAYGSETRTSETSEGGRAVMTVDDDGTRTTVQLASGRFVELSHTSDPRLPPPLGKDASYAPPPPNRGRSNGASPHGDPSVYVGPQPGWAVKSTRRRLYWMRGRARQLTAQHPRRGPVQYLQERRQRACGLCSYDGDGVAVVVSEGGSGRFVGVQHCGSVWACPTCRAIITTKRAAEVSQVVEGHGAQRAYLLTLTLAHQSGDDLAPLRRGLGLSYRKLWGSAAGERLKAALGIEGSIRAMELTHGRNGWHPHIHALLLLDRPLKVSELARLEFKISKRWRAMIAKHVGEQFEPSQKRGADLRLACDGKYITKLGLEMSDPGTKRGRGDHRTPLQILADVCNWWTERDARLWREYARGMKGARQLMWSRGLKVRHGIVDRTDAELAGDEVLENTDRIVGVVGPGLWRAIATKPGADVWLIEQTEKGGTPAFHEACRRMVERLEAAG